MEQGHTARGFGSSSAPRAAAITYRRALLAQAADREESASDDEGMAYMRAYWQRQIRSLRRELAVLDALPEDASMADVRRAMSLAAEVAA